MPTAPPAGVETDEGLLCCWIVDSHGTVTPVVASNALSAAFDILTDDGYPGQKAADILVAAERHGHDPEAMARKMVRLRRELGWSSR